LNNNNLEELIIDYLDDKTRSQKELPEKLKQAGIDLNEIENLKDLYKILDDIPVPLPGESLDEKFYSLLRKPRLRLQMMQVPGLAEGLLKPAEIKRIETLENIRPVSEKIKSTFWSSLFPKLAYSTLLIALGLAIGRWLLPEYGYEARLTHMSKEILEFKEISALALLNQSSSLDRIKGVNSITVLKEADSRIINSLLYTLNNDPNTNVRLVTIDALAQFVKKPEVRQGLIQSITRQESPLVQIALADLMVSLKEKNSIEQFRTLLSNKELNYTAKARIEECLKEL
jgi:hypothetical protein